MVSASGAISYVLVFVCNVHYLLALFLCILYCAVCSVPAQQPTTHQKTDPRAVARGLLILLYKFSAQIRSKAEVLQVYRDWSKTPCLAELSAATQNI